jgi:hypothetical protein
VAVHAITMRRTKAVAIRRAHRPTSKSRQSN